MTAERNALTALWKHPLGVESLRPKRELRRRARKLREHLVRFRGSVRAGELSLPAAGRTLARIGYYNTLREPVEWARDLRQVRRLAAAGPSVAGNQALAPQGPEGYGVGLLWRDVLGEDLGGDRAFELASRRLAIRAGAITEQLDATARLAGTDPAFRQNLAQVNGRARELSGWFPRIPGPVDPVTPAADNIVLHLVKESRPFFSNGFTSRSHENFKAEKAAGLEPVVLTEPGFPRSVVGDAFAPVEDFEGIVHHRLDTGIGYGTVPSDRWLEDFAWLAYRKVREIRPAVIHVSSGRRGFETALVALALKAKTGIPVVYEVRSFFESNWTSETEVEDDSEIFRRRVAVENVCMREADHVLTLGTAMRDELVSRGVPPERISLVPNGVNLENFSPGERDEDLASRHGITMPTFGYVSNMDHYREGQELLVRAAALLQERGVRAQCVLVGGGDRVTELKGLAAALKVSDRVVFTGPVPHERVPDYYRLIDVFVVPRVRERAATYVTPLKPFEAMVLERPVVVSDLPALAEIVDAPHRGLLFEPEDHVSLADVVQGLLADPAERARLGRAGRDWVEAERQWKHNGPRYRTVFESVITRARRRATATTEGA
ncbi:glycosyltransferase family 4 protein [Citricoccus sp.]|uniref:glycosyltransferase family 4 protein n=1 Tax=Citricoccus sp. TaxID=1978372 RepID=UPI00260EC598|nr:glycosyltransferase family 4 protein [Citricoccus sp.]HRO30942.1 glycosyltransferase family 4 protein [Citricoccus sp.]HRO93639.1 glycosyltransferase family 4 protein [Citricoccus sp.]